MLKHPDDGGFNGHISWLFSSTFNVYNRHPDPDNSGLTPYKTGKMLPCVGGWRYGV